MPCLVAGRWGLFTVPGLLRRRLRVLSVAGLRSGRQGVLAGTCVLAEERAIRLGVTGVVQCVVRRAQRRARRRTLSGGLGQTLRRALERTRHGTLWGAER
ncbi:hypothetical protein ACIBI7_13545 [Nonomuraea fuscirosea]|uniref:hypothetical protein n=1 Tax=Nonomuraea fuscirosea TaxID=1291556 RepID=UPI0037B5B79C